MQSEVKKIIFGIMFCIILLTSISSLIFQQNSVSNLNIVCINAGFCSGATECNVSVFSPEGVVLLDGVQATQSASLANYNITLNETHTSEIGEYQVGGFCKDGSVTQVIDFTFEVNYLGKTFSTSQAITYLVLFIIVFFIFGFNLFIINILPASNTKDEEGKILSISYLKYLRGTLFFFGWMLFVAILFLSSNLAFAFLSEQLFAKILFVFYKITFGLTPLIVTVWLVWIFVQMFHDRQLQKLLNRGFFPQGKL